MAAAAAATAPLWPKIIGAIGSAIGGIGGLFSGLKGSSAGDAAESSAVLMEHQANVNRDYQKWYLNEMIPKMIKMGYHPLAALGMQPTSSGVNPIAVYGDGGRDLGLGLEKMGQSMAQFSRHWKTQEQKEAEAIAIGIENEKYKQMRIETAIKSEELNDLRGTRKTGNEMVDSQGNMVVQPMTPTAAISSKKSGVTMGGAIDAYWVDEDGKLHTTISKDASEPFESDEVAKTERAWDRIPKKIKSYFTRSKYPPVDPSYFGYPKSYRWRWIHTMSGGYWQAARGSAAPPRSHYNPPPHKTTSKRLLQGGHKWGRVKSQYR